MIFSKFDKSLTVGPDSQMVTWFTFMFEGNGCTILPDPNGAEVLKVRGANVDVRSRWIVKQSTVTDINYLENPRKKKLTECWNSHLCTFPFFHYWGLISHFHAKLQIIHFVLLLVVSDKPALTVRIDSPFELYLNLPIMEHFYGSEQLCLRPPKI